MDAGVLWSFCSLYHPSSPPFPPYRTNHHLTRRFTLTGGSRPPRRQCFTHPRMRCAHPYAHSVLHALHTLALSPSSVSHPSRYPSPSSHLGFVVSCADSSGFRIRFALSNSWIRIHGMGTMGRRVIHRRIRPLDLLCLLTASPNSGKRPPLDEFVALDIRLRLAVFARRSACTPRPMYEQLHYRLALLCYARASLCSVSM